jgi:dipeptidyl aminopeptidase/acylaminoacyl peptidase
MARHFSSRKRPALRGASEYADILAAGRYLQSRPDVDGRRIGIWGASLGGYLTALGQGRNPDVFAAGVDIHGAHDRIPTLTPEQIASCDGWRWHYGIRTRGRR